MKMKQSHNIPLNWYTWLTTLWVFPDENRYYTMYVSYHCHCQLPLSRSRGKYIIYFAWTLMLLISKRCIPPGILGDNYISLSNRLLIFSRITFWRFGIVLMTPLPSQLMNKKLTYEYKYGVINKIRISQETYWYPK